MSGKKGHRSPRPEVDTQNGLGFFQIAGLILLGAAVILGLFTVIESVGPNKPFIKALTKILGSIATVFTTYFLINRAMRVRERESDAIVVSFVGYIDYLIQTYGLSYGNGPEDDDEANGLLNAVRGKDWQYIEEYAERMGVSAPELPRFLMDAICWPSYLRTSEERMIDIHESTQQITALLGVCSPKMATAAMEIVDCYSDLYRDDLPVIRRGLRAFRKLEWIAKYGAMVQGGHQHGAMQEDIAESLSAILEAMQYVFQKLPGSLEDELRANLNKFRSKLHKRYHEAYDRELEAVGEVLDID